MTKLQDDVKIVIGIIEYLPSKERLKIADEFHELHERMESVDGKRLTNSLEEFARCGKQKKSLLHFADEVRP